MKVIVAFAVGSLLSACSQGSEPVDFSREGMGVLPGCPALPGVDAVRIKGVDGPDFRLCKATHTETGKVLFEIYVGEHPAHPEGGLRYGGTTSAHGRTLIWFKTPGGGRGMPRLWRTYLPTGSPRGTVMVVTLVAHHPEELERITPLIAHLTPSR